MPRSADVLTSRTRDAANASAAAVVAFAWLFLVTTQIGAVREVSPFAEDPYDLVASLAAILLPLVAGATWVRSLAHRQSRLSPGIAWRIVVGSLIAVAMVAASLVADAAAMLVTPGWASASPTVTGVIVALVGMTIAITFVAAFLLQRAATALRRPRSVDLDTTTEPDVVDDALDLAVEVADRAHLRRVRRPVLAANRFFERSPLSPRRHRAAFGVLLALAAAVAFVAWHAFREGPWASPAAALIFGSIPAVGILATYALTVVPLRLLRPVRD
jgi:hypothetical protein